jgi:hypothetical protein
MELEATVEELEALRDISEQLEESQSAVEKQLRSELCKKQNNETSLHLLTHWKYPPIRIRTITDAKEIEILDQAGHITNLNNKIADLERTLENFRIVVRAQQVHISFPFRFPFFELSLWHLGGSIY